MAKQTAKFSYEFHWRNDIFGLIETVYNQFLPMIGTALLLSGNFVGFIFLIPLILNIRIDPPKTKGN